MTEWNSHPCPAGTFQDLAGQTACKPCGFGRYQDKEGQAACVAAELGKYGSSDAAGEVTPTLRAAYIRDCETGYRCSLGIKTKCPTGKHQDDSGKSACKDCQDDIKYQDEEGQASCKDTGAGYYAVGGPEMLGETTTGNGRTGRKQCSVGTRCKDGKSYKCPSGEYVDEVGQERNACLKITDGLKYAHGYGSDTFVDHKHREWPIPAVKRNDASACVDGHQCDNGHKEACAKGKYSDSSTCLLYTSPSPRD